MSEDDLKPAGAAEIDQPRAETQPDKDLVLVRADGRRRIAHEWYKADGLVDLSAELTKRAPDKHALVRLADDSRPRFLIGHGYMVDILESLRQKHLVFIDARDLASQGVNDVIIKIGGRMTPDTPPVSGVIKASESINYSPAPGGEEVADLFDVVKAALRREIPQLDERAHRVGDFLFTKLVTD